MIKWFLGVIKYSTGSIDKVSNASICSETLIEPISAVIVAPTLPDKTTAEITGASSSKIDSPTMLPTVSGGIKLLVI